MRTKSIWFAGLLWLLLVTNAGAFYDPGLQRWINRDPIEETGGINLYCFIGHDAINYVDLFGYKPGDSYPSLDAAAVDACNDIIPKSIKEDLEYGGKLYKRQDGTFGYTRPKKGSKESVFLGSVAPPPGTTTVGDYHTHGAPSSRGKTSAGDDRGDYFSSEDKAGNRRCAYPGYIGTPTGKVKKFDPNTGQTTTIYPPQPPPNPQPPPKPTPGTNPPVK